MPASIGPRLRHQWRSLSHLPAGARGILRGFEIDYRKKSRGPLWAECHCEVPADATERECHLTAEIRNAAREVTAVARARWRIGPEPGAHAD